MLAFAREHGVAVEQCGKLVVATNPSQLPALDELLRRGRANGVPCRLIDRAEALEYEPAVSCVAALRVESTAIVDYVGVSRVLARLVSERGGEIRLAETVERIDRIGQRTVVGTSTGEVSADLLLNCAGLYSDRIAAVAGARPDVRIIPFRGEYYELTPAYAGLVKGLIYPVPDPSLPFLGVHLTRMIGGGDPCGAQRGPGSGPGGLPLGRRRHRRLVGLRHLAWPLAAGPPLLAHRIRRGGQIVVTQAFCRQPARAGPGDP